MFYYKKINQISGKSCALQLIYIFRAMRAFVEWQFRLIPHKIANFMRHNLFVQFAQKKMHMFARVAVNDHKFEHVKRFAAATE